jgi:hypothetical protein
MILVLESSGAQYEAGHLCFSLSETSANCLILPPAFDFLYLNINFNHSFYLKYFKNMKNSYIYIFKIYYIINHIIFNFFIFLNIMNNTNDQN